MASVNPVIEHKNILNDTPVEQVEESPMIVVHCTAISQEGGGIRIWPSTFLFDSDSPATSKMLHVFGVTMAPDWTYLRPNEPFTFTLVFEPLPKSCTVFDFLEKIPFPGGFHIQGIKRNKNDVYRLQII